MRNLKIPWVLAFSITTFLALPSCLAVAAAAVGAAGVVYVNGDLEGRLEAPPERVVEASQSTLEGMDIHIVSTASSGVDGRVVGRTALDKKVDIRVNRDGSAASKISIRVDTFGDEALSRSIFEAIEAKL
jgi:hypothetical protein